MVREALVCVDNAGEIDPGFGILNQLRVSTLGNDDGKRGRRHEVAMAQGPRRFDVEVRLVGGLYCLGELADFLTADVVNLCGRVAAALQVRIDTHGPTLSGGRTETGVGTTL